MKCKATVIPADRHQVLGIILASNNEFTNSNYYPEHPELIWGKGQNLDVSWWANVNLKKEIKEDEKSLKYWKSRPRYLCYSDEDSGSSRIVYDSRSPESLPNVHCYYTANPEEAHLEKELEYLKKIVQ